MPPPFSPRPPASPSRSGPKRRRRPGPRQTEDARLTAFLDAAFDEQIATNPQTLTQLGSRQLYDRLNDYTDAYRQRQLALGERQLAEMRRRFNPARLSPAGRLSFRLFEKEVLDDREGWRWRDYGFPATNNGSPMGNIPVFLINNHRVDSVADAEAYVARLREVERVMREIAATMRRQTAARHRPAGLQFRAGARGRPPRADRRARSPPGRTRRSSPTSRPR